MRYTVNVYRDFSWQWDGEASNPEEAQRKALEAAADVPDKCWDSTGTDEATEPIARWESV